MAVDSNKDPSALSTSGEKVNPRFSANVFTLSAPAALNAFTAGTFNDLFNA